MADPAGLVHLEDTGFAGTHALVIGIGKYPHLIGGEEQARFTDGMRQLSSPPVVRAGVRRVDDPGLQLPWQAAGQPIVVA